MDRAYQRTLQRQPSFIRLSANQGHQKAQFQLGMLYKKGHGVAQDYQEATRWLKKSLEEIK